MRCQEWEKQILRLHEKALDREAQALLLRHLESCVHCRALAEKSSELDGLFAESGEPSLPPFLKDRIVSSVSEAMREDSTRSAFSRFFGSFISLRPLVAAIVLVLGVGLGLFSGWNLARSITMSGKASSDDLISLAVNGDAGNGSYLEFILADSKGRIGQ